MGDDNDFYSAVQDGTNASNFNNPTVFASKVHGHDVLNGHGGDGALTGDNFVAPDDALITA
ncbi:MULTISPECIES: hypothetical protein [Roseobacteraceae]|uniref:Uncharacterized protein n=1 Tax=Pseudosulfitobacter pseudonitzschiae TaxID=1402135 RepID=A0A221JYT1_9RHOB|nr:MULTISPECIES: hypothetical protein [Roseobacteraceae]ASM71790.1 hypothetical protein SULPSESMR1_00962 [Pseudosulfitobacter pseudonitzschiae]